MSTNIDSLNIQITASANGASRSLKTLESRLTTLSSALNNLNTGKLDAFTKSCQSLANVGAQSASIKTLAEGINRFGYSSTTKAMANMGQLGSRLQTLATQVSAISTGNSAVQLKELATAINSFGYKSTNTAVANIPRLATAMNNLLTTLSRAPKISNNTVTLTRALADLSKNLGRTYTTTTRMPSLFNNFGSSMRKHISITNSLASAIGRIYAAYFMLFRVIKLITKAVSSSMDYIETFNYYNVTMKKVGQDNKKLYQRFGYESADAYADSFKKRLNRLTEKMSGYELGMNGDLKYSLDEKGIGLDPNALMNFQARISAVTNSVGLLGEAGTSTAKALSMLSGDLSSLTNTDLSSVMTNLQSGLIGQSRALYKYGIDITNATLAEYAYANGIKKKLSAMTQGEKMQLRVLAILDQSKVAWGDNANRQENSLLNVA